MIAKGLKIVGSVTAEGLVEVNGQIDGELQCTSLVIAVGLRSMEPLQPNAWLWMEQSKVQFTAVTSFSSRRHMSSAIYTTNLLPLRGEPILTGVRCKCEETDKHLRNSKQNHEANPAESLSRRIERAQSAEIDSLAQNGASVDQTRPRPSTS